MIRRFEDLKCWQMGRQLTREIYKETRRPHWARDWGLVNQMRRAAVSIPSNIAEGFERGSRRQQIESCYIARGSAGELRTQVIIGHDVGYLDDEQFDELHKACIACSQVLYGYIQSLKRGAEQYRGQKFEDAN